MEDGAFSVKNARYKIIREGYAVLNRIEDCCKRFIVPSEVFSSERYQIVGITDSSNEDEFITHFGSAEVISFDESSEIEKVQISFVYCCRSLFYLPQKIKRIEGDFPTDFQGPKIILSNRNKFVSVIESKKIMNHFPLEILDQHWRRSLVNIRETIRIIGFYSFYSNKCIRSVVIPSSVEVINSFSFNNCSNLEEVKFSHNSHLKTIGRSAFSKTSISLFNFPAAVEEIGDSAFYACGKLSNVLFSYDSKLRSINDFAFSCSGVRSVTFPKSVQEIGNHAFYSCNNLSNIHFPSNYILRKIGENTFAETCISSLDLPPLTK